MDVQQFVVALAQFLQQIHSNGVALGMLDQGVAVCIVQALGSLLLDRSQAARLAGTADTTGLTSHDFHQIVAGSAFSILICADGERAFSRAPEYWIINSSIAGQNMILAAESLGLGSVWLGIWPQQEKVQAQKVYFNLPESVTPHSIIAFGYPDEDKSSVPHKDYEEDRVHFNKW